MENRIKCITSVNQLGSKTFAVGCDGITEIKEETIEFENSIDFIYTAYKKDGKKVGAFINGALAIDYF